MSKFLNKIYLNILLALFRFIYSQFFSSNNSHRYLSFILKAQSEGETSTAINLSIFANNVIYLNKHSYAYFKFSFTQCD